MSAPRPNDTVEASARRYFEARRKKLRRLRAMTNAARREREVAAPKDVSGRAAR